MNFVNNFTYSAQLRLPNRFEKINLQLESCEFWCLGECLLPGARRADVTGFGMPEHPGDDSVLPRLGQSGNLSRETGSSGGCRFS
jgi:hypothetical protein